MSINVSDVDDSLRQLNSAIKNHYLWMEKLLCLNLFGGAVDSDIMDKDSHLHCQFSEWLTLRMQGDALDRDVVQVIHRHHHAMHNTARMLTQAIISGTATKALVRQHHECQQIFIESIETYKSNLFAYRNQHDALTGLPLRHLLYQEFATFRARCERNNAEFYLLIMDIDRFKSINDTFGHNAGDEALCLVAHRLNTAIRKSERLYRFGGEEFIILLEVTDRHAAECAAERIRCCLSDNSIHVSGQAVNITVTGGLTRIQDHEDLHGVIGRADQAMYYGKNNGRNCCVMAISDGEMRRISPSR